MSYRTNLPNTASVVHQQSNGRLFAPAAEKNLVPITKLVTENAPCSGKALEIASGTGQHVLQLAMVLPNIIWQPSDVDEKRIKSINARSNDENLINLLPPCSLDATEPGWSKNHHGYNLLLLINLIHLISLREAETLIYEMSKALISKGRAIVHGPFMRNGRLTSVGDEEFHFSLINSDPEIGYKNDSEIIKMFNEVGLTTFSVGNMPANNLAFTFEKR